MLQDGTFSAVLVAFTCHAWQIVAATGCHESDIVISYCWERKVCLAIACHAFVNGVRRISFSLQYVFPKSDGAKSSMATSEDHQENNVTNMCSTLSSFPRSLDLGSDAEDGVTETKKNLLKSKVR